MRFAMLLGAMAFVGAGCSGGNAPSTPTTGSTGSTGSKAPQILGFVAAMPSVVAGQSTTLTAYFVGGTGKVDQGVGEVQSGVGISVSPTASTTYTLTVTGPGGTATASVEVKEVEGASLTITLDGDLPSAPQVTVFGPMGPVATLASTQTLTELAPGDYHVTASSIAEAGVVFFPLVRTSPVTLTGGDSASVEVTYYGSDASLNIGSVADQVVAEGSSVVIPFTVDDVPNPPAALSVSASSSAPDYLPPASLVLGGAGANRTLTVTAPTIPGTSTVTLTVVDAFGDTASTSFLFAVPYTVTNANDTGPGSLRGTIAAAQNDGFISFDPSVTGPIVLTSGTIAVSKALFVQGPGARVVSVTGNDSSAIFSVGAGATLTVSGLTFTHAKQAIQVAGNGTLHVADCAFLDNSAARGAAIANQGATVVDRSLFSGNVANCGSNCNTGGGAVTSDKPASGVPSFTARDSTFTANSVGGPGATFGAAMAVDAGALVLTGCTVTGNICGALCGGGAVDVVNTSSMTPTTTTFDLARNVIAGNIGSTNADLVVDSVPGIPMAVNDHGNNVLGSIFGYSSGLRPVSTDLTSVADPMLSALGDHGGPTDTLVPLPGSPALNLVSLTDLDGDLIDQRGQARRADGTQRSDSGATDRVASNPTSNP